MSSTPTTASSFDANTNRIQGVTFDADGNATQNGAIAYTYDAMGRMTSTTVNSNTTTYVYDGLGQRVSKINGGQSVYVCDAFGQLAAEYGGSNGGSTRYLTQDNLGSTRAVTDASGNPVSRHDFLPFGEEVPAGINGRGAMWSSADGVAQKFTGKERDAETANSAMQGLDFFESRYLSAAQGRFTSVDPENAGSNPYDPQSWNGYAYARNNPLVYTDPTGMNYTICDSGAQNCRDLSDDQYNDYSKSLKGSNIYVTPSGTINAQNDNGSVTRIGTASYYDEKKRANDVRGAQFLVNQTGPVVNALAGATVAFVAGAGIAAAAPAAAATPAFIPQVLNFAGKQAAKAAIQGLGWAFRRRRPLLRSPQSREQPRLHRSKFCDRVKKSWFASPAQARMDIR